MEHSSTVMDNIKKSDTQLLLQYHMQPSVRLLFAADSPHVGRISGSHGEEYEDACLLRCAV
jgi:hypothetical protein